MIWIKNHGVTGSTDNLRQPLKDAGVPICCYSDDGKTTPVVVLKGWTGLALNDHDLTDDEVVELIEKINSMIMVARDLGANHDEFDNKSEELDAYHNGEHPEA